MRAPHGPAIQEIIADALSQGQISPLDVDAAEVHGEGRPLADVIDIATALFALRAQNSDQDPTELPITSVKSAVGHAKECTASQALIKVCMAGQIGAAAPNVHLRCINPYLDARGLEDLAIINSEAIGSVGMRASYISVTAHGFGGSNSHALVWNTVEGHGKVIDKPPLKREAFVYWPGGGGELEDEATDCQGYHIVGSWTRWEDPEPMEPESNGVFGYTVVLGENSFERFHICLDGDPQRVLHPGQPGGTKSSPVFGPDEAQVADMKSWMIDGRRQPSLASAATAALQDKEGSDVPDTIMTTDTAAPGEAFRVRLHITGRWRVVTWEKLGPIDPDDAPVRTDGIYYVTGDFNGWTFDQMTSSLSEFGVHTAEVLLDQSGSSFQIVRDKSPDQVIYPAKMLADADARIMGPDSESDGRSWWLQGQVGDNIRIDFSRMPEAGEDVKKLSWRRLSSEEVTPTQLLVRGDARLFLVGSSEGWEGLREMRWDGSCYTLRLLLGPSGRESFQILVGGSWDRKIYPSLDNATPEDPHDVLGPDNRGSPRCWEIHGEEGEAFKVKLFTRDTGPGMLTWESVR